MGDNSPLSEAWLRVLETALAGLLSRGEVTRLFKSQFCEAMGLLRAVDDSSGTERYAAVESLMRFTGRDSPEIKDVLVAAVRRGIRDSSAALQAKGAELAEIERVAVGAVLGFESRLAAIGGR